MEFALPSMVRREHNDANSDLDDRNTIACASLPYLRTQRAMGNRDDQHLRALLQEVVDTFPCVAWDDIICFRADILIAIPDLFIFLVDLDYFART